MLINRQRYPGLTNEEAEHFLERGHLVLRGCFSPQFAAEQRAMGFKRLGYDPDDRSTWKESRIHMPNSSSLPVSSIAPRALQVMAALLGGEDRIAGPVEWGDGFIINFHQGSDQPWHGPSPRSPTWHKDGDWFRHFLDSPEQGLLEVVVWSEIEPRGGGTFLACDSVAPVARFLADRPEGVEPREFDFPDLVSGCRDFVELTGSPGDVAIIHPFLLHTVSQNHSDRARFITNPAVSLNEPMQFDRPNPEDYSLVERGILRGLGVDRLSYRPTHARERIHPERERVQKRMKEEQDARLASSLP